MATIFCFTSTGNSLYTAKKLAEKIGGKVLPMHCGTMQCDDDVIGFVFPNYFWGIPRMVERFISGMQMTNKAAYVFAILTCGGPGFGELGSVKALLRTKGIRLQYGTRLISVTNYLPEYALKDSLAIRRKIDGEIMKIAEAINNRETHRVAAFSVLNKIIHNAYPNERCDQHFTVAPTCTGCMTCQKVCPASNIAMNAQKPAFQHRCEHCLACLHHCPVQAIDWKQKTQGKERYRNAGITVHELIAFNHPDSECAE